MNKKQEDLKYMFYNNDNKIKQRKTNLKLPIIISAIGFSIVLVAAEFLFMIIPNNTYTADVKYFDDEQHSQTHEILQNSNPDFKDSAEPLPYYDEYIIFSEEENDYEFALEKSIAAEDYKNSENLASETIYQDALVLLENREYMAAFEMFQEISDFKDSAEMLLETQYRKGLQFFEEDDFTNAFQLFNAVDDYKDASARAVRAKRAIEAAATVPPTANVRNVSIFMGQRVRALDFVYDITSSVSVSARYGKTPDFTVPGTQAVNIILEDVYGNTTEYSVSLDRKSVV